MNNQLVFKSHTLTPVIINNQPYLGSLQIASALEYGQRVGQIDPTFGERNIRKLYERHADEFTPDMSFLTTINTNGGKQQVRVFSLRGCHLLAMFSKTLVAKEFRRWVLDLIENNNQVSANIAQPNMRAIGGVVKKCCTVAVRDELKTSIQAQVKEAVKDQFLEFMTRTFACAEKLQPFQEVSDHMLMGGLYNWYSTRHHAQIKAIQDLRAENDMLKSKMATIRAAAE